MRKGTRVRLRGGVWGLAILAALLALSGKRAGAAGGDVAHIQLKTYQTRYYTIYTDIEPDKEMEAAIRMTRMAEEYHARTLAFSGAIRQRLPFYLFKTPEEYYQAGAPAGSAGVFITDENGSRLMAIAEDNAYTWHVIQHEGFHQFAAAVIGGDLPTWVNEGIAEYFGEAVWTGDGFVAGVIPPDRLKRVQSELADQKLHSVKDIMLMSHDAWNQGLAIANYDQAWSMVQFLAHGDDGKYQGAFNNFMIAIGRHQPWDKAWMDSFGPATGFEDRWQKWLAALPEDPTAQLYAQARVATLTSFLARAVAEKQSFTDFDQFKSLALAGQLKIGANAWLPPDLLSKAVDGIDKTKGTWSLQNDARHQPQIVLACEDQTRLIGSYILNGNLVQSVAVIVDTLPRDLAKRDLLDAGKKAEAQHLIENAMRLNAHAPEIEDARKFLRDSYKVRPASGPATKPAEPIQ